MLIDPRALSAKILTIQFFQKRFSDNAKWMADRRDTFERRAGQFYALRVLRQLDPENQRAHNFYNATGRSYSYLCRIPPDPSGEWIRCDR
jgi:hypothetical protein